MAQTSSYDVVVAAVATVMRVTTPPTEVSPGQYSFSGVLETAVTLEPIEDETVNLVINDEIVGSMNTSPIGYWTLGFTLPPGTHNVKAAFPGTAEYEASETSVYSLTPSKIATEMQVLTAPPATASAGVPFTFDGILYAPGPQIQIEGATVNLYVNAAIVDSTTTAAGGAWAFGVSLSPGTHDVKASFPGTAEYEPSETTTYPVTTSLIPTIMFVDDPPSATAEAGVPFEFFGLLQEDPSLVVIPGKTVNLYVDASLVDSTVTGVNGVWTFNVVLVAPGTHTIYAEFPGDDMYLGCSEKISVARWLAPAGLLAVAGGLVGIAWLGR